MKILSEAQRQMFERAASDESYAKLRGITSEMARDALNAHKANGGPKLPDRINPQRRTLAVKPSKAPRLLQSMREG